jgi:hypothetical protein
LLDFSRRSELGLHAAVIGQVQAAAAVLGVRPLIVGAFARDLHFVYAHAIPVQRQTEDLDLALAVPDWEAFEQIKASLLQSGNFSASKEAQRLRYGAMPLDLVPFGRVEAADGKIAWPPRGEVVMDVFGFREAQEAALPGGAPGRSADRGRLSGRPDAAQARVLGGSPSSFAKKGCIGSAVDPDPLPAGRK